jgi:murein hydrolase activator
MFCIQSRFSLKSCYPYLCLTSLGLVFSVLLLSLTATPAEAARKKTPPNEELKALRGRINELQKDIAKKEDSKSEVADNLKESEKEISETNRTLSELALEQKETSGELSALQSKTGALKSTVVKHQADLEKLIKNQYQSGSDDALKLLLNGQDPAQVSRHMHYYSYLSKARAESIQDLKTEIAQLKLVEDETRATAKELAELREEEARQKKKLLSEREKRKNLLDKISGQIKPKNAKSASSSKTKHVSRNWWNAWPRCWLRKGKSLKRRNLTPRQPRRTT